MTTIEVIAIGNEVLSGFTLNTNATFISQKLIEQGWLIHRHTVLPDAYSPLLQGLKEALQRSSVLIITGGLGPTGDDITKKVAADLAGVSMRYDEPWAQILQSRYQDLATLDDQATVPESAILLPNSYGTAPGLFMEVSGQALFFLPGVPAEMRPLFTQEVMPRLEKLMQAAPRTTRKILHFYGLRESDVDIHLQRLHREGMVCEYGIYPALGLLTVHLIALQASSDSTDKLYQAYEWLKNQFSEYFFSSPRNTLEDAVFSLFTELGYTLSVAESCTGGALAARCTCVPGASRYFLGGIIAYSNEAKCRLLEIDRGDLEAHGAVSDVIARQMARQALQQFGSDYAVAVTGIAGPTGGTDSKPIGTVWCALASRHGDEQVWLEQLQGDRAMIVERTINRVLGSLYSIVRSKKRRQEHHCPPI